MTDRDEPRRRSASAEAAALGWSETHPDDVEPPPPARSPTDDPPRRSASAEAAALRRSEEHPEEESDEVDR